MSFALVYERLCDFEEQVIGAEIINRNPDARTLRAPKEWPEMLTQADLPLCINTFGRFQRNRLGTGIHVYQGPITLSLYLAFAGDRLAIVNQFDNMNIVDIMLDQFEAYPGLEINNIPVKGLFDPIEVADSTPIASLRYPLNAPVAPLFWGAIITLNAGISKDC